MIDREPPALPPLPDLSLVVVGEEDAREPSRWVRPRRPVLVARGPGGDSERFTYDLVERELLDAVVVVAHYVGDDGRRRVLLRSALRPPVALRPRAQWPFDEPRALGAMWEVVAGLVEADERSPAGLRACAARELFEEVGARVSPDDVATLGPSTFPCPGVIGERHHYFHVAIDPRALAVPAEDGSVLERGASIIAVALDDALALARAGELPDAKTELALRRLAELG